MYNQKRCNEYVHTKNKLCKKSDNTNLNVKDVKNLLTTMKRCDEKCIYTTIKTNEEHDNREM